MWHWSVLFNHIPTWFVLSWILSLPATCYNIHSYCISYAQVILGEEVAASKLTIFDITKQICDAVQARAEKGMPPYLLYVSLWVRCYVARLSFACQFIVNIIFFTDKNHGVVLIPEGLVESIPELYALLQVSLHIVLRGSFTFVLTGAIWL